MNGNGKLYFGVLCSKLYCMKIGNHICFLPRSPRGVKTLMEVCAHGMARKEDAVNEAKVY